VYSYGKWPLPRVGHELIVQTQIVAPRVHGTLMSAPRKVLPVGLGRELLASPCRVRPRVLEADLDDRMIVKARQVAAGPNRARQKASGLVLIRPGPASVGCAAEVAVT